MPTDDDRREVARRLRELERGVIGALIPTGELAEDILRAIDYGYSGAMTPYGCLADLIEPPARCPHYMHPCCRTDAGGDYIDRDALLALADELERPMRDGGYSKKIARRIREACGEGTS